MVRVKLVDNKKKNFEWGVTLRKLIVPTPVINHFSTTGRYCGTPLRDACVRQASIAAIVTSSFKIF